MVLGSTWTHLILTGKMQVTGKNKHQKERNNKYEKDKKTKYKIHPVLR